ncbi:integrin beta-PS [Anoplophora glabripennis]|uniref:integrin beta-PS n=1 Tax=Anoplophora glabripennis TaxID=217634 RepID=UPI0008755629|nr:integrin beta-PS [Anoplophora glabripennis]
MELPSVKHTLSNCLILSVISAIVIAQMHQGFALQDRCKSKSWCHECIQTPGCAWCMDPEYKGRARCFQPASDVISNELCREEFSLNPDNMLSVTKNLALTRKRSASESEVGVETGSFRHNKSWSGQGSINRNRGFSGGAAEHERVVQVAPQRLSLKLRARETYSVRMYYSQAEDYPVDLYYLMDLSKSMEDDKNKLYTLGDQLATTVKDITSNFKLGLGSVGNKLCNSCEQETPYGFRHHMTLSNNTQMFSHMVKQANVSGTVDISERGFDAIMQAIVCKDQIGWRDKAGKFLVFSTDASFHFAGDGKLGDEVKPNDGSCHLSHEGYYTRSSYQDYPSIEQINLSVKKNNINVIFAITNSTISFYEQLARNIEGASVGKLEDDTSNIVELIKEQYNQFSSTVEMKHNASSDVNLKFYSRCLNSTGALVNTNKCENIRVGDLIHFKIDIEVLKCPKNRADQFQTISIYPVGIDESLIIDLEMLCECDCEKPGYNDYKQNSSFCSHRGTYKCGICECTSGAFGPRCECSFEETYSIMDCTTNPRNPTGRECSGRGQCFCGRCECEIRRNDNEKIYGSFCECDNFSCERYNGKLCGDHGTCECGKCLCKDGWMGSNCACQTSTANCYPPGSDNNVICSGHGICDCGQCVCDYVRKGRYTGEFCEKSPWENPV